MYQSCRSEGVKFRRILRGRLFISILVLIFLLYLSPSTRLLSSSSGPLLFSPEMPGTLLRFPSLPRGVTMPALLNSLPRGINPPTLPRGITMPSMPTLPSLPSMPRGVTIPSLPRGMSLPRAAMPAVTEAPRRLLQDCYSVLDHQTPGGNGYSEYTGCFTLRLQQCL